MTQSGTEDRRPVEAFARTGIEGLDQVLEGGLRRGAIHLVEGEPGTGKTTFGLQFSRAGVEAGERVLYFSFSETVEELQEISRSHGWSVEGVDFRYLNPQGAFHSGSPQTMIDPGELYLPKLAQVIQDAIERIDPHRLIIDSLSDLRLVSQDLWLFRAQLMLLRDLLATNGRTTLLLDSMTEYSQHLRTIASGIVTLEQSAAGFGALRRRLNVVKMRARSYVTGHHDFRIVKGGIRVYPRFARGQASETPSGETLSSGLDNLDALVGGGLERGSSVLLLGPAGVGKSILVTQYTLAAAARGERALICLFDERRSTFLLRAKSLGLDLEPALEGRLLNVWEIDPGEMSPGEFGWRIRQEVEKDRYSLVVIDSLSGYLSAMSEESHLSLHLHELLSYLGQRDIVGFLVLAEQGPISTTGARAVDLSYLTDSVLLLRYFEYAGEMRRALSVYKKRSGPHERLIREIQVGPGGLGLGAPLRSFRGILSGFPEYVGEQLRERTP